MAAGKSFSSAMFAFTALQEDGHEVGLYPPTGALGARAD